VLRKGYGYVSRLPKPFPKCWLIVALERFREIFSLDRRLLQLNFSMANSVGYLFERFPRFTQTFCAREVAELYRQAMSVPVFSIYRPKGAIPEVAGLDQVEVHYLPSTKNPMLIARAHLFSPHLHKIWAGDGDRRDKRRFREAIHLGPILQSRRITHLHVHFADIAAHTAWWLKRLFGMTYSFTGHANDIFCPKLDHRISLDDLVRDASFVVGVTDYSANRLKQEFPSAGNKIFRVYNGLDPSIFKSAVSETEPLRIVSVGRLIEKKGWRYLIEACALLRDHGLRFDCRIVGDGPDEELLQKLIQQLSLTERVHLTGPRSQTEIVDMLAESSLFVFPAIRDQKGDSDNLPTVLIEALASSLPIVATTVAGIPEIVKEGSNGVLVPEKDSKQLALAIERLSRDPARLRVFGIESRRIAEETFTLHGTVAQLKMLLEGVSRPNGP
jgi:colanic acid/amylovoran biosynthesis glycosyltransferase